MVGLIFLFYDKRKVHHNTNKDKISTRKDKMANMQDILEAGMDPKNLIQMNLPMHIGRWL